MNSNNLSIINRLISNSAEIITKEEFAARLSSAEQLTHYIGFEISGYVHLGTGLMSAMVMKDLTDLGVQCTVWLADWHTIVNQKLDGTRATARRIGLGYFAEALKASFTAIGGNPEQLEIRLASDWYDKDWMKYWEMVIRVSQNTTTSRVMRSIDIMGRQLGGEVDHARTIYPSMQVADIFYQNIDIAHAGMDQRKAHAIMRDVANKVYKDKPKPIALHHPLLVGLQKPLVWPIPSDKDEREVVLEMKMSKSKAKSAIWVHDSEQEIREKINAAFCPEREVQYNPILNWVGHLLFWQRTEAFNIGRKSEHGGDIRFNKYEDLALAYAAGEVHPLDLKAATADELIRLLAPVREHFAKPEIAAMKAELDEVLAKKK